MNSILQLSDRTIAAEDIIPLMSQYQLLPQFLRGLILDEAIATIDYSPEERFQFCEQYQLNQDDARQAWLQQQGMTPDQLEAWITRELKIRKFQQIQWGSKLNSYFLQRKDQLDRVVCSLIHVQEQDLANELYFRIAEGEETFTEIARRCSQGPEAYSGGIIGPIELGNLHPSLAQLFHGGEVGRLWEPILIGEWFVIAQLDVFLPVQFDDTMRQYLLNERLEAWLQEQVKQRL
jgi:parvulin-like peptidyl-prolyl isomerase